MDFIPLIAGGGMITVIVVILGLVCTIVPTLVGLFFLFQWGKQVTDTVNAPNRAPNNWPWVRGRILDSQVDSSSGQPAPQVTYEYVVNGATYQSQTIRYGKRLILPHEVPAVVERFRPGTEVMVYYNPANPAEAILQRE
jgi:hypothetical protein